MLGSKLSKGCRLEVRKSSKATKHRTETTNELRVVPIDGTTGCAQHYDFSISSTTKSSSLQPSRNCHIDMYVLVYTAIPFDFFLLPDGAYSRLPTRACFLMYRCSYRRRQQQRHRQQQQQCLPRARRNQRSSSSCSSRNRGSSSSRYELRVFGRAQQRLVG